MSEIQKTATKRRDFLKILGATTAASLAPVAVSTVQASEKKDEQTKSRYKETDHVKAYYRTNSY